jgi:two-component system sensor histidine kinase VicK
MPNPQIPLNELNRLAALRSYHILDTATEKDFDDLTELASAICGTPIALISLVDKDRQWFKSHKGTEITETHRDVSFCAHAINKPTDLLEVVDARADERFKNNPLVTGETQLTFYAGVPLIDEQGFALGSLCVLDREPKKLTDAQQSALKTLAAQVVTQLKLRRKLIELENAGTRIQKLNALLTTKEREAMQIIEHTPMAMALHTGEDMNIRFANKTMLKAWGKDETVLGMPFHQALPELAALDFPRTMRQVYRKGIPYHQTEERMVFEHEGALKEFYYNYSFTPLLLPDGQVWGVLNTALEVTQMVKSRLTVERAEESLRLAVQSANLGTWHFDSGTKEFSPSVRLKELFGYGPYEEMSPQAATRQVTDEYRDSVINTIRETLKRGESYDLELPIINKQNQELRWIRATGRLYPATEHGQPAFFSGTVFDITEHKKDEQRKNDFIGMVSHELKSPLTSLNGFLQMLQLKAVKADDQFTYNTAEKSLTQVKKMTSTINGFLNAARLGSGKIQLHKQKFLLNDLISESINDALLSQETHLFNYPTCQEIAVEADRDKIGNVLSNLLSNAVKYSPGAKQIEVNCMLENGQAKVSITDHGMGITAEDQSKLFDRFFRVQSMETRHISGHGIGLYLCAEIIQAHGGHIGVESQAGQGSTFWFSLPVA